MLVHLFGAGWPTSARQLAGWSARQPGRPRGAISDERRRLNEEHAEAEHLLHSAEDALGRPREDLPTEQDVAAALKTIDPLWAELFPAEKERIVRLLVESVTGRGA
jgi:hypothetical protein